MTSASKPFLIGTFAVLMIGTAPVAFAENQAVNKKQTILDSEKASQNVYSSLKSPIAQFTAETAAIRRDAIDYAEMIKQASSDLSLPALEFSRLSETSAFNIAKHLKASSIQTASVKRDIQKDARTHSKVSPNFTSLVNETTLIKQDSSTNAELVAQMSESFTESVTQLTVVNENATQAIAKKPQQIVLAKPISFNIADFAVETTKIGRDTTSSFEEVVQMSQDVVMPATQVSEQSKKVIKPVSLAKVTTPASAKAGLVKTVGTVKGAKESKVAKTAPSTKESEKSTKLAKDAKKVTTVASAKTEKYASPDIVVKSEELHKTANLSYKVADKRYYPKRVIESHVEVGIASWYGPGFHGRKTSNGERFDMNQMTAAHPTLPIPSYVKVTNLSNGKTVVVRINDRGPFHGNRVLDLSKAAAQKLGFVDKGMAKVRVEQIIPKRGTASMPSAKARQTKI